MDDLWIIYGYGWWYTHPSEKSELVSWEVGMIIPNIWENKQWSKPPTSINSYLRHPQAFNHQAIEQNMLLVL